MATKSERPKPHDLMGFIDGKNKDPDRRALGFMDHKLREKWAELEGNKIDLEQRTAEPSKEALAKLEAAINHSVTDVDVVGWLCQVYDIAITKTKDRKPGWKDEVRGMWEEINYHWHLTTSARDKLDDYYQKLLKMKDLELWNDRDTFSGTSTGFQL